MKTISHAALFVVVSLAAGRGGYAGEPIPGAEPVTPAVPSDPLTPRQEVGLRAAERLDRLDDTVAMLKIRCDEKSECRVLAPAFRQLLKLRTDVLVALVDLRDPAVGFNAAEHAVSLALSQYDLAIQIVGRRVEELSPHSQPLVSR